MPSVKTAISLPGSLYEEAEELAGKMGVSRSRLYAMALENFIERCENQELLRRINAAYAGGPDAREEADRAAMRRHQRELTRAEW